jgi:hypothetical protein
MHLPDIAAILNDVLDRRENAKREKTIVISKATMAKANMLLERVDFVFVRANWTDTVECPPFDWQDEMEVNRADAACTHLKERLQNAGIDFDEDFQIVDVHADQNTLDFADDRIGKISGGADLLITPNGTAGISLAKEACVVVELLTRAQLASVGFAKFVPSAVVAFVSANCKSNQPAILTVLTDLSSAARAWESRFNPEKGRIEVSEYIYLDLGQMVSLIAHHLNTYAVRDPRFVAVLGSNDVHAQRQLMMKRKRAPDDMTDAFAQFDDLAEGTSDWSRGRAEATWHLLRCAGVEQMPAVVRYSMMNT